MIPDPEKAIIAALTHYMPELTEQGVTRIHSQPQKNWSRQDSLIVRATPGGASRHPRLFTTCFFEIEAFANTRGESSRLARTAGASMAQASLDKFRYVNEAEGEAGYLFGFREVNTPSLIYDGLSSKHGDTFMFQGTYQISVRALR